MSVMGYAQKWTWTGEDISVGTSYYLQNAEYGTFIKNNNKLSSFEDATVWTLSEGYHLYDGSRYYIQHNKSGLIWHNKSNSTDKNATISIDNASIVAGAKRIRNSGEFFTANSSTGNFTHSSDEIKKNNWLFYSVEQKEARDKYLKTYETAENFGVDASILEANNSADYSNAAKKTEALNNAINEKLAGTSAEHPLDVTFLIKNPNFNTDGEWSYVDGKKNSGWNSHNLCGGLESNRCAEVYHKGFTLSQTIEGLPNGVYEISMQGFYRQDDGANQAAPVLFGNNKGVDIPVLTTGESTMDAASESFTNGNHQISSGNIYVMDGKLTLGIRSTAINQWCIFDNFSLLYKGPELIDGCDMSSYIVNARFENDMNGWNTEGFERKANEGKFYDYPCIQVWSNGTNNEVKGGNINQIITGLPTGHYRLTAKGWGSFQIVDPTSPKDELYAKVGANGYTYASTEIAGVNEDPVGYHSVDFYAGNTNVEIGVTRDEKSSWWTAFSDFTLTYLDGNAELFSMSVNASAQYGTFVAPFDVTLPSGVEASTAVINENGVTIDLESVGETIPANTPVILYAEDGLTSTTFYGVAQSGTAEAGCLTGTYDRIYAPEGSYILQNNNNKVGFYLCNEANKFVVAKNRCYLTTTQAKARDAYYFDGEETAIQAVDALTSGKAEIYDLSGRKLNRLQKGINIVNGVKILVK